MTTVLDAPAPAPTRPGSPSAVPPTPPRGPAGLAETGWAAALLVIGAVVLGSAWQGWLPLVVLAATAVLALALVRGGLALRLSGLVVVVSALALVVLAVTTLLRAGDQAGASRPWELLADAVPRLVTGPRPAPPTPDLLAPGVLLAGLVGTLVGVRLGRARRLGATPLGGGLVLHLAGTALTAGTADRFGVAAAALVVVAALGWGLLDAAPAVASRTTARQGSRRRALAAGTTALVVVPVVVGGALLDRASGFDPRTVVEPPVTDVLVANPLPFLDAWARDPERTLFTVRGAEFPLHLAVLTEYDGAAWAAPSAFRPLGEADPVLPPGDRRATVDSRVTLVDVPPPWLPVAGSPQSVSRTGALVDVDSGSLIDPRARAGTSYDVVGVVDAPDDAAAAAALPTDPASVAGLVDVPGLPEGLRQYALSAVEGTTAPFARAKAVEAAVRGTRTLDPTAPGGSSYRRIESFLLGDDGTPGAQSGGSEQFAGAFAVLARAVGLPTRVVVGFTPGEGTAADGTRTVRGRDALAWPEVHFEGAGWVPFSPTPDLASLGPDVPDDAPIPSAGPTPQATPSTAVTVEVEAPVASAPDGADLSPLVLGALAVLAVVLAPFAVLALLRVRRRATHRRAGARGAWSELLDVAALADLRAHEGVDARELATALDARAGGRGAATVERAAEREAWGPGGEPSSSDALWEDVRAVTRGVRRRLPVARRALWSTHPRPLRRRGNRNIPASLRLSEPPSGAQDDHRGWAPGATGRGEGPT